MAEYYSKFKNPKRHGAQLLKKFGYVEFGQFQPSVLHDEAAGGVKGYFCSNCEYFKKQEGTLYGNVCNKLQNAEVASWGCCNLWHFLPPEKEAPVEEPTSQPEQPAQQPTEKPQQVTQKPAAQQPEEPNAAEPEQQLEPETPATQKPINKVAQKPVQKPVPDEEPEEEDSDQIKEAKKKLREKIRSVIRKQLLEIIRAQKNR